MEGDEDARVLLHFIGDQAKATDPNSPQQVLSCLAHAYAVLELLNANSRWPDEAFSRPEGLTFEQALARLREVDRIDAPPLDNARCIFELLSAFEAMARAKSSHMFGYRHLLGRSIPLTDVWDARHERRLLEGTVTIWHLRSSQFRSLRRRRKADVSVGPMRQRTTVLEATDAIRYYRQHSLRPRPEPAIGISGPGASLRALSELLTRRIESGTPGFSIALCPLLPHAHPVFRIADNEVTKKPEFTVNRDSPFVGTDLLLDHVNWLLEQAAQEGLSLLILPELAVPALGQGTPAQAVAGNPGAIGRDIRMHLANSLLASANGSDPSRHPLGVVAGSFHIWSQQHETPVNQTVLLDRTGREFLTHNKMGRFRMHPGQVAAAKSMFSPYPAQPLTGEIVEGIDYGRTVQFLDSALAQIVVLICVDAIESNVNGCIETLKRLQPDIVYIVSMSSETEIFETVAAELATFDISTVFVNARAVTGNEQCLAFMHLALIESPGAPPTRIRWRTRHAANGADPVDVLERFDYRGKKTRRTWVEIRDGEEASHGLKWLTHNGTKAALVIDIGAQWSDPAPSPGPVSTPTRQ